MAKHYLLVPDLHFPMHSRVFFSRILWALKNHSYDGMVQLGDAIDCTQVGRYPYSPERSIGLLNDIKAYGQALSLMVRLLRTNNPNALAWQLEGNHEARLGRYLHAKAPEIYQLVKCIPEILDLAALKVKWCPLDSLRSCVIGGTVIHHGHYFTKNIAQANLRRYPYNFIQGHTHRLQWATDGNHWSLSLGCGCDIEKTMHTPTEPTWTMAYAVLTVDGSKTYPTIHWYCNISKRWHTIHHTSLLSIKSLTFD